MTISKVKEHSRLYWRHHLLLLVGTTWDVVSIETLVATAIAFSYQCSQYKSEFISKSVTMGKCKPSGTGWRVGVESSHLLLPLCHCYGGQLQAMLPNLNFM